MTEKKLTKRTDWVKKPDIADKWRKFGDEVFWEEQMKTLEWKPRCQGKPKPSLERIGLAGLLFSVEMNKMAGIVDTYAVKYTDDWGLWGICFNEGNTEIREYFLDCGSSFVSIYRIVVIDEDTTLGRMMLAILNEKDLQQG